MKNSSSGTAFPASLSNRSLAAGLKSIVIDADAATGVPRFDFEHLSPQQRFDLSYEGPGVPYLLRPAAKTLVIGPGGGWDIARALASGSKDITAVEINPIIANVIMREKFPQYSNHLYSRPEVKIVVEDGRSFVRRSHQRYDVLQATLVDTWASTAAGAFALSENNLYTTNAFIDYLSHLTDHGVMAFTRWGFQPPRESLRVVSLAYAALKQLGQKDPARNIAVLRQDVQKLNGWGAQDTILVSPNPFSPADLARIQSAAAIAKSQVIYLPGAAFESPFGDLLLSRDLISLLRFISVRCPPRNRRSAVLLLYRAAARSLAISSACLPRDCRFQNQQHSAGSVRAACRLASWRCLSFSLCRHCCSDTTFPAAGAHLRALLFFLFIGAGYILIQVALIQKFILFLGHPTYALTVIIFSMLLSSGFGSFASKRLVRGDIRMLSRVLMLVIAAVFVLSVIVTPIAERGVGLSRFS